MSVLVGKQAPLITTPAVVGGEITTLHLSDYRGKYVVLFFYPLDFTFVCPTELHAFQEKLAEFEKLGCVVLGCSVDSVYTHKAWLNTPKLDGGIAGVQYGLLADVGGKIARDYGILNEDNVAYRGLFLIDKTGIVRHQVVNDLSLGRSVGECLRMVEALQHVEAHGEVCPANWQKNSPALTPSSAGIINYFNKEFF